MHDIVPNHKICKFVINEVIKIKKENEGKIKLKLERKLYELNFN